ncbi:hypothetical protein WA026_023003 [Henosepilachna vigintioctopunctata]|uniref:C2H2-type domain-containing protein n=1 Tax=Henosepilachna vigintioctopunctata TaxID=420089 RepID=A0AAW1UPS8_9CUCU
MSDSSAVVKVPRPFLTKRGKTPATLRPESSPDGASNKCVTADHPSSSASPKRNDKSGTSSQHSEMRLGKNRITSSNKSGAVRESQPLTSPIPGPSKRRSPACTSAEQHSGIIKYGNSTKATPNIADKKCNSISTAIPKHCCAVCKTEFNTASKLATHKLKRECQDRTKCLYCGAIFPSFKLMRQHERRQHPLEYSTEMNNLQPMPEEKVLETLATIEASTPKGSFYNKMCRATGLTQHQVRYRRENPIYKKYLDRAIKKLRENAKIKFTSEVTNNQTTPPIVFLILPASRRVWTLH